MGKSQTYHVIGFTEYMVKRLLKRRIKMKTRLEVMELARGHKSSIMKMFDEEMKVKRFTKILNISKK